MVVNNTFRPVPWKYVKIGQWKILVSELDHLNFEDARKRLINIIYLLKDFFQKNRVQQKLKGDILGVCRNLKKRKKKKENNQIQKIMIIESKKGKLLISISKYIN